MSCAHCTLDVMRPSVAWEKCVFPCWLAVVPGACWLLLGAIGYKEGAAPKTSWCFGCLHFLMFVYKYLLATSQAIVQLWKV